MEGVRYTEDKGQLVKLEILNEIILRVEFTYINKDKIKHVEGFDSEENNQKLQDFIERIKVKLGVLEGLEREKESTKILYEKLTKIPFIFDATFYEEKQSNDARMSVDLDNLLKPTIDLIFGNIMKLVNCESESSSKPKDLNKCPLNDSQIVELSAKRFVTGDKPRKAIVQLMPFFDET